MNGVLGIAELMSLTQLNEQQRAFIKIIQDSGQNLLTIIEQILDFSRIEAGKMVLDETAADIRDLSHKTADLLRPIATNKGLDLQVSIDPSIPQEVMVDSDKLRQILTNLLSNAVKFTKSGTVELKVLAEQSAAGSQVVQFSVRDTGIGIAENETEKLFKTFSQVDSSNTRKFGGTGLGLAISDGLARLMGGKIHYKPAPVKGSVFSFAIPLKPAQIPATLTEAENHWQESGPAIRKSARILIAEDDEVNVLTIVQMIKHLVPDAKIMTSGNGKEAVEKAIQSLPDLILMDIQMPVMDGNEATTRIRQFESESNSSRATIIGVTARSLASEIDKTIAAGMDDCLIKPISIDSLEEALSKHLAAS
jgi:CheY-like chemotaxis protein/two-component sensor histidine kinase